MCRQVSSSFCTLCTVCCWCVYRRAVYKLCTIVHVRVREKVFRLTAACCVCVYIHKATNLYGGCKMREGLPPTGFSIHPPQCSQSWKAAPPPIQNQCLPYSEASCKFQRTQKHLMWQNHPIYAQQDTNGPLGFYLYFICLIWMEIVTFDKKRPFWVIFLRFRSVLYILRRIMQ